jgi:hypothetical protein
VRIRIKAKKKTKNEDRAWQRSPRYWVAMGTLAAYTTVSGSKLALAYGQDKGGGSTANSRRKRSRFSASTSQPVL